MTNTETSTVTEGTLTPLRGIRRAAAKQMIAAWQAPAFHLTTHVDMGEATVVKRRVPSATVTDVILQACARALVDHPGLNSWYEDMAVRTFDHVNIGLAVATQAGLTVPVIHNVQDLSLEEIAKKRREIVDKARSGALTRPDITGGTFTVSNLGMLGVDSFDAILNVPQVAILAIPSTREQLVWNDGEPQWRPIAGISLTCDHRAVDGAEGAAFLGSIKEFIQAPSYSDLAGHVVADLVRGAGER